MRGEKCVAARLTQCWTGQKVCTDLKVSTPLSCYPSSPASKPLDISTDTLSTCFHHLWVCAYTFAWQALGVSYGHSLQTVCFPLLDTGAILASSSDAHHPSVRSPCRSLQAKVTRSHSSSSLAFCPRVQVVWKRVNVHVCLCGVCVWLVCLSCHKLHSVRGEALQESSVLVTDRGTHTRTQRLYLKYRA